MKQEARCAECHGWHLWSTNTLRKHIILKSDSKAGTVLRYTKIHKVHSIIFKKSPKGKFQVIKNEPK
jgi:hypothetical protein